MRAPRVLSLIFLCVLMVTSPITITSFAIAKTPSVGSFNSNRDSMVQVATLSDSITVRFSFRPPTVSKVAQYHSVKMRGLSVYGSPGKPVLPYKALKILIPQGMSVRDVQVSYADKRVLEGKFFVEYGETPKPTSSNVSSRMDKPNPVVYESAKPFPEKPVLIGPESYLRGYKIAALTVYPVQYIPKEGQLSYFRTLTITVNLKETDDVSPWFRGLPQDEELVANIVDNPEAIETYTRTAIKSTSSLHSTSLVNASESYEYVIITNGSLQSAFQPLINWRRQNGINATIVLVQDILKDPDYNCNGLYGDGCASLFNDTAAHIRNFIKDAYLNWGTDYVLLGGDDEIIPVRGVYAYVDTDPITVDYHIPCDMYYGALDGSWDKDNDTIFGEGVFTEGPETGAAGEEADFFAEVYIGRATVDTPQEAANFVNKVLAYEQHPNANYIKKAVMIGEQLDDETEGGNGKDMVTDIIPQYTTTRLYHRDGTFSSSAVINALNSGVHIVNHDGHANQYYDLGLHNSGVDALTNTEYFLVYSLGCYAAAFDQATSGDEEAIAEHFIFNSHGAFAFIGNSRYGWYIPGTAYGPGEQFDRSFYTVLDGGVRNLGKTLQISKENLYSTNVDRWTYFTLNLLGDPETKIVKDLKAPTAHFNTVTNLLTPPSFKGVIKINGTAVKGTAPGATFANFTIEFGAGTQPTSWSSEGVELTANGQTQIVNDVLAVWNTTMLAPGIYTLKLTVYDLNGTTGEDRWVVNILPVPVVCVNPQVSEVKVGQAFTLEVNVHEVDELFGLDIMVGWNTTLLEYVNHTVMIPVEEYAGGILHQPVAISRDKLNKTGGTYWITATSHSTYGFSGNGTVFTITFKAKNEGSTSLKMLFSDLTDEYGHSIPHIYLNGVIEIASGSHELAVRDLSPEKSVVCKGYPIQINVTVMNLGTYVENFNLTVYVNGTAVNVTQVILVGNTSKTVTVTWNTTGWKEGNYTLGASVSLISGETNKTDNTLTGGHVRVSIPGDVDGDGDVDICDVSRIAGVYGSKRGDSNYKPESDINDSGKIEIFDVVICTSHYGQTYVYP